MQTWIKYAVSFFALVLILAGFIFAFGPAANREAFRNREMTTGQLNVNAHIPGPGEPTQSGTTLPADGPATEVMPAQRGRQPLTNGTTMNPVMNSGERATGKSLAK